MQEAFLVQMDYFDRFLEAELRQMLDLVVARRPPARSRHAEPTERLYPAGQMAAATEPMPAVEPLVVVTLPVASVPSA